MIDYCSPHPIDRHELREEVFNAVVKMSLINFHVSFTLRDAVEKKMLYEVEK